MIYPKEVNKNAGLYKVSDRQIEKDYVLTWILNGIANHKIVSKALVFKGGTVIKKCYIEDYRFSEDLDFTLLNESLTHENIKGLFNEVFAWVKEEANITLQFNSDEINKSSGSTLLYSDYVGPLAGDLGSRDLKIDVTRGEIMEFPVEEKSAFVAYSDIPLTSFKLQCYSLSEVLIEKMAALMGRTEPRDLYDFWYLTEIERMKIKDHKIEFFRKAKNKDHDPEEFVDKVLKKEQIFRKDWVTKLQNQIHDLPKFDDVFREAKRHLEF